MSQRSSTSGPRTARRRFLATAAALPAAGWLGAAFAQDKAADNRVIRIGSGPTGATEFLFGGLIANAISNPPGSRECDRGGNCGVRGLIAVAQTTGGPADNLRAVSRGDLELGLTQADAASWAFAGAPLLSSEPMPNLRVIARLYPTTIHLVVRANATIAAFADLKGKKIGIGAEGSAQAATAKQLLSAHKLHWNQVTLVPLAFTAMTDALASGKVDALFMISAAPVLALEDLARKTPIRIVPIAGPTALKIAQALPFYSQGVIPAGVYGSTADVQTLDVGTVLIARDTMDDELAFGIARAIWHERNVALFQNGHPCGKLMVRAGAALGVSVPIHPGAIRYYAANAIPLPDTAPAPPPTRAPNARSS